MLGGSDRPPNLNLGGRLNQLVQLITTLAALPTLESSRYSGTAQLARAPISVIRVRVAGVTGPNPASLNRIKTVAEQIEIRTHLTVDIVAGSSPPPTAIALPADSFGTPALLVSEDWVKKGVAITILNAVDRSSVVLFVLILVVCALFVANSATAAVRGRRHELGVLAALGWTRPRLFVTVLGEVAVTGLIAGLLGAVAVPAAGRGAGVARLPGPRGPGHPGRGRRWRWWPARYRPGWPPGPTRWPRSARRSWPCAGPASPSAITGLAVVNVLRTPGPHPDRGAQPWPSA